LFQFMLILTILGEDDVGQNCRKANDGYLKIERASRSAIRGG